MGRELLILPLFSDTEQDGYLSKEFFLGMLMFACQGRINLERQHGKSIGGT